MNVFMYILFDALLCFALPCFALAEHLRAQRTIFPSHVITKSNWQALQTLICHHSHWNCMESYRIVFYVLLLLVHTFKAKGFWSSIQIYTLVCCSVRAHFPFVSSVRLNIVYFSITLKHDNNKCHSSPSSCCPLFLYHCDYMEASKTLSKGLSDEGCLRRIVLI